MSTPTATEKLAAIVLVILAVLSPLYIGRERAEEQEDDEKSGSLAFWFLVFIIFLIFATSLTCFMDQRFTRFDLYWIHRVGGSSCGIFTCLLILGFVLKCKTALGS